MRFPASPVALARLLGCALLASAGFLHAQTLFVCLGGKAKMASVISIPAPGHGWDYSAAAPVPGDHWNRVKRTAGVDATDPAVAPAGTKPTPLGFHALDTAQDLALTDARGNATDARLTIRLELLTLAGDKPRTEPAIHSKSKGAVPTLLMESAWRIYLPDNALHFTVSGLAPGQAYDLYTYAASVDPVSNPDGLSDGARFTLAPANIVPGDSGTAETRGGFGGGIYTFNPETDKIAPSPAGTTWVRIPALADARGQLAFRTNRNSEGRHFINGFQIVQVAR